MAFLGRESEADLRRAEQVRRWAQQRSPYALFSVLLGTLAMLDFITLVLGVALGILAIGLGLRGLADLRRRPELLGRRLCFTGIGLGSAGLVLATLFFLFIELPSRG